MTLACSGYNVKRIQDILNQIRVDSGKYVQIDRQRAGILASINKLELKAAALSPTPNSPKNNGRWKLSRQANASCQLTCKNRS